jgi:osmotically-inducible protein OsmY
MTTAAVAALITVGAVPGMSQEQQTPDVPTESAAAQQEQAAQEEMSPEDRQLAQRVEQALREDQQLARVADNIQVKSREGKVKLTGTVNSQDEKQQVERKAGEVTGVQNVENEIQISEQADRQADAQQ